MSFDVEMRGRSVCLQVHGARVTGGVHGHLAVIAQIHEGDAAQQRLRIRLLEQQFVESPGQLHRVRADPGEGTHGVTHDRGDRCCINAVPTGIADDG